MPPSPALRRALFVMLWLGLLIDLLWLSPPPASTQGDWVLEVLQGDWAGKNPATVALFNLMGVWPLALAVRLRAEWNARPLPAWPFLLGSLVIGAFSLLPYLILQPEPPTAVTPARPVPWWIWGLLLASGAGLLGWGLGWGDLAAYRQDAASIQLIQVMSLDFLALMVTFLALGRARTW